MRRIVMWPLAFAFVAAQLSSARGAAGASDDKAVMRALEHFVVVLHKGDMKAVAAASAPSADVVDDFAPHHWSGPHALDGWAADFGRSLKAAHITEPTIAIASSAHTQVDGEHAFAPLPTVYRYRQNGKAVKETGVLVFALDRIEGAWKIVSMSWAPTP